MCMRLDAKIWEEAPGSSLDPQYTMSQDIYAANLVDFYKFIEILSGENEVIRVRLL